MLISTPQNPGGLDANNTVPANPYGTYTILNTELLYFAPGEDGDQDHGAEAFSSDRIFYWC